MIEKFMQYNLLKTGKSKLLRLQQGLYDWVISLILCVSVCLCVRPSVRQLVGPYVH